MQTFLRLENDSSPGDCLDLDFEWRGEKRRRPKEQRGRNLQNADLSLDGERLTVNWNADRALDAFSHPALALCEKLLEKKFSFRVFSHQTKKTDKKFLISHSPGALDCSLAPNIYIFIILGGFFFLIIKGEAVSLCETLFRPSGSDPGSWRGRLLDSSCFLVSLVSQQARSLRPKRSHKVALRHSRSALHCCPYLPDTTALR